MNFDLSEEHRLVEQSTREWAAREVSPRIQQLDREHTFDRGLLPKMAELGLLGICVPAEVWRRGHGLHQPRRRVRRARVRRHVDAGHPVGARRVELSHAADVGDRGAEAEVSRSAGAGHADRHVRSDRAVRRQRCTRNSDDGREARRSLRVERREDVDLAGRCRRYISGDCVDRSREETKARSVRPERVHCRARPSKGFRAVR